MASAITQWREQIARAAANGEQFELRGGGSKAFYGQPPRGEVLDTRAHSGIVSYEPTELVVTARGGTPLAELEETLAARRQMLAFEPPHFGDATVGGCVAAGLAGPRRIRAGAVRDFVLGAQLLDGNGKLLNFGGQVMKNVAGYDISRLLAGSLGILGIITEVSLKVLPLPETEQTRCFTLGQADALVTLRDWAARPLPISASAWQDGQLRVRISGAASAVAACARELGGEPLAAAPAAAFWQALREQQLDFFPGGDTPLWRVALPGTAPVLDFDSVAHDPLLEWNGCLRWLQGELDGARLRQQATALGGHVTLFRGGDKSGGVFSPLPLALLGLHQRLKKEFDPAGVFNPGRLYPGL